MRQASKRCCARLSKQLGRLLPADPQLSKQYPKSRTLLSCRSGYGSPKLSRDVQGKTLRHW